MFHSCGIRMPYSRQSCSHQRSHLLGVITVRLYCQLCHGDMMQGRIRAPLATWSCPPWGSFDSCYFGKRQHLQLCALTCPAFASAQQLLTSHWRETFAACSSRSVALLNSSATWESRAGNGAGTRGPWVFLHPRLRPACVALQRW